MKVWLCKFEGLLTPKIVSGPFEEEIPDNEIVKALKNMTDEADLLFWVEITVTLTAKEQFEFKPTFGNFTSGYMDKMRSKALE